MTKGLRFHQEPEALYCIQSGKLCFRTVFGVLVDIVVYPVLRGLLKYDASVFRN